MRRLRNGFMLALMLCKRLYKKPSFIVILLMIVAVTGAMSLALSGESSMVRVTIVEGNRSKNVELVIGRLLESDGAVAYSLTDEQAAYAMLKSGETDAVWQFDEDFDRTVAEFAAGNKKVRPVKVTVRETDVFLVLTRERLYAEIFPFVSKELYRDFISENLDGSDEQTALGIFKQQPEPAEIVQFEYYNDEGAVEQTNYLVTPLRALLSIILSLCSMAAMLYFIDDCENGHMDAIALNARYSRAVMYCASGTLNAALFMLAAVFFSGIAVDIATEAMALGLLVIGSIGFATLIGGITAKTSSMAAVLPILLITMIVVCPVFLNLEVPVLSWLFAPYWYLGAVYNQSFLPYMALYCAAVNLLSYAVWKIRLKA